VKTRLVSTLCLALALAPAAACRDRGLPGGGEKPDPEFAKKNLLSAEPTPKQVVNADLGGKVVYLGCDLDKTTIKPGEAFTITHYIKVVQPPGGDYRLFTHVKGMSSKDWMNVDATKMRSSYPTSQWKAGDIIKDEQKITLKGDWSSSFATIDIGLYKKGDSSEKARLPIVSGPNDGHGAVIAAKLTVEGKGATAQPPSAQKPGGFVIKRASGPITVDGKADEPSWATAPSTGAFQQGEGLDLPLPTTARLMWDDKYLYVYVDVTDEDVYSEFKKPDDPLWKQDAVELFVDADKNGKGYVELQVNPQNAQFDSWFAGTRQSGPPGDEKWTSGIVSAVVVDGTLDKRDDKDKGWHAEIAVPLAAVKGADAAMAITLPPKPGDSWKMNIVRVEGGKDKKGYTASAWAPITRQDFHAIDKLYTVTFGDEKGDVPAAAPAPAPSAPTAPAPSPAPAGAAAPAPTGAATPKADLKRATVAPVAPVTATPVAPPAKKTP
jgi:hypothetical protein